MRVRRDRPSPGRGGPAPATDIRPADRGGAIVVTAALALVAGVAGAFAAAWRAVGG